jgi:hypothetical protein
MRTRPLFVAFLIVFAALASGRGALAQALRFTTP